MAEFRRILSTALTQPEHSHEYLITCVPLGRGYDD